MGDTTLDPSMPTRMTTRGIVRSYAEEANDAQSSFGDTDSMDTSDSVFRVPNTPAMRGRKRRIPFDDMSIVSDAPKRGRPRGGGVPRPGRGGVASRRSNTAFPDDDRGLFGAVKYEKDADAAVDEWIERYDDNQDAALVELQQFILSSCGCRGRLTADMLAKMEYSEIIRLMTEEFDEESGDYPIIMAGSYWKKFKPNFSHVVMTLINKCKSSIIFNGPMMDAIIQLLTGLADSQVRAFRHTATYAAMKLSSALVDVTMELVDIKSRNQKQIASERLKIKNMGGTTGNEKLDVLIAKKNEVEEQAEEVRQMLTYIFKSVFVHRYRDVLPDIRSICISELGNWMLIYPEHFLDDSYLKYIGWSLHDKVPDVRLKCVLALLPLYQKGDIVGKLELFTNKFKNRLVSMVMDRDNDVAVQACALMTAIYRAFPTVLSGKDCAPIYELVYTNYRPLAVAAGEFLNTKVFNSAEAPQSGDVDTSRQENPNRRLIVDLMHFFIEGECHSHGAYLVDALIDTNEIMRDWRSIVEVLKSDDSTEIDSQLVDIMCCAVKQAATGEHPVGRAVVKRGQTAQNARETRHLAEERTRISEVFIPHLPVLLQRYIVDREKVLNLVSLPLFFQLEMYVAGQLTQHAVELMRALEMVVEKHPDSEVLMQVAEVIHHLTTCSGTAQITETARAKLLDGLVLQVRVQVDRLEKEELLDDDDEAALKSAFRKVVAFASAIDPAKQDVYDKCVQVSAWCEGRASSEVVQMAVQYMSLALEWDLLRLVREQETNKTEAIRRLRKRCDLFFNCCEFIMTEHVSGLETTSLAMCDILIMFSENLAKKHENLRQLVVRLDPKLLRRFKTYIIDNVFMQVAPNQYDQQEQVELMMKRRRLLSNFGKLVVYGVICVSEAAEVFSHYVEDYSNFGDIMKMILHKARDLNMVATARAVGKAMQLSYEAIRATSRNTAFVDPVSEDFTHLRELAKRLAIAFGNDHLKNREAIASVHRDGIVFALEITNGRAARSPQNVSFLEVILEFSHKLIKQDKQCILRYLDRHAIAMGKIPTDSPKWSSYALYKDSLKEKHADDTSSLRSFAMSVNSSVRAPSVNSSIRGPSTPGRRGRPPKNSYRQATPTPSELD